MENIRFEKDNAAFTIQDPDRFRGLYLPVAGEGGLKSVFTPTGGGDSKLDQNTFVLEPVSIENLHNNRSSRNFWCRFEDGGYWSAFGASADAEKKRAEGNGERNSITAGFMWQRTERETEEHHIKSQILCFADDETDTEIVSVTLTNTGSDTCTFSPFAAIPLYGRSADNIRDHRHVTSLLHRIKTIRYGVEVTPTLSFDERGHEKNSKTYYVYGMGPEKSAPDSFFPTTDMFIGECGTYTSPEAVICDREGVKSGTVIEGREAVGGLKFHRVNLKPGEQITYTVFTGIRERKNASGTADNNGDADGKSFALKLLGRYGCSEDITARWKAADSYWNKKVNIRMHTSSKEFDMLMRWVCFQPFLRRIYGCSFLPHHDYGRGGRGWRDLWQDCLALLIMDPTEVRSMIVSNFGGVRLDGTNATIIGDTQGEFKADRNGIPRVWMDHGMWPLHTVKLYLDQSGDYSVLDENVEYFKDRLVDRGYSLNGSYSEAQGTQQLTEDGSVYKGTVLEHLLVQNILAAFDVGEHGIMRLRGADWNDALDMATNRGESVAFTCAYAGNLKTLAEIIRKHAGRDSVARSVEIISELACFIEKDMDEADSSEITNYLTAVRHNVSGLKCHMEVSKLAEYLERKADKLMALIRAQEWITLNENGEKFGWYNSYYDNSGKAVEGLINSNVRMMLTGQVFSVMSGTATDSQVADIVRSADHFLYEKNIGGYRLNTNFHEEKYDLGRAFGFAFGEKENGAVFSHMSVMYAYALYMRGFAAEGYKALNTLADAAMNFEASRIYPGIPEYFNNEGRGLYSYLTGAGSWYALTMVTCVYGVRGRDGDLEIAPMLMGCQFDSDGNAGLKVVFAGAELEIVYHNPDHLDPERYMIGTCMLDGQEVSVSGDSPAEGREAVGRKICIPRGKIGEHTHGGEIFHNIEITLREKK